jgi:hypothetical protein
LENDLVHLGKSLMHSEKDSLDWEKEFGAIGKSSTATERTIYCNGEKLQC